MIVICVIKHFQTSRTLNATKRLMVLKNLMNAIFVATKIRDGTQNDLQSDSKEKRKPKKKSKKKKPQQDKSVQANGRCRWRLYYKVRQGLGVIKC